MTIVVGQYLIWITIGREIVVISRESINIRQKNLITGINKEYPIANIDHIRLNDFSDHTCEIAFDFGPVTARFGDSLEESEGRQILELMKKEKYIRDYQVVSIIKVKQNY